MDKETLSNYGWIVICVLVLAVMLALATPFGTFVADAVKSTTQGLFDVNKNALNSTGLINIDGQEFESCAHDYEVTTTGDCSVGQITTTQTCKLCGKTSTETVQATHKFDNASDMNCNVCNTSFTAYVFDPVDYDGKMGTTISTDANVVIPETFEYNGVQYKVKEICSDAFNENRRNGVGSSHAVSIVIPNSVTDIRGGGIAHVKTLKELYIPVSVTYFHGSTFYGCTALETVHYGGTIAQWNSIPKSSSWNGKWKNVSVICTDGTIAVSYS